MSSSATDAGAAYDPLPLAVELIRCASVTPREAGALAVLERVLGELGFRCHRLPFESPGTERVDNLYARLGDRPPHFCYAGHTDVVPEGERARWSRDPFAASVADGVLFGRGASDMKGAIAAFIAALRRFLDRHGGRPPGSISLLITGDEEGVAVNGTKKVLEWLKARGETIDHCLVGEPTNPDTVGDMIKIGRRGSMNGKLTAIGTQGHVAYPHLADNPIPRLLRMVAAITAEPLDRGTDYFQPSNLELTSIDVGNAATNVIPALATAQFNIRFNPLHTSASLTRALRAKFDAIGGAYEFAVHVTGEAFLSRPGPWSSLVAEAVKRTLGREPELSTTGGTSDARFIKDFCPVVEFGLISQTMHKIDEQVPVADVRALVDVYAAVLEVYFAAGGAGHAAPR
ncbi:MAG: succinyl-diaminopimelate desuccinylase [Alphaproteobacteria bacterium]|nr:succinyl-diaminopimelate desuccinylase [Alphaproteobacteria bacterium]